MVQVQASSWVLTSPLGSSSGLGGLFFDLVISLTHGHTPVLSADFTSSNPVTDFGFARLAFLSESWFSCQSSHICNCVRNSCKYSFDDGLHCTLITTLPFPLRVISGSARMFDLMEHLQLFWSTVQNCPVCFSVVETLPYDIPHTHTPLPFTGILL